MEKNNEITTKEYSGLGVEKTNGTTYHKLNSTWVFWYASRREEDHHIEYGERLKALAEFDTLEDFMRAYMYIKSAEEIDRNTDLSLFKKGYKPLWEACPDGGCWFIRFKKTDDPTEIDKKWEKLVFALIGYTIIIKLSSLKK